MLTSFCDLHAAHARDDRRGIRLNRAGHGRMDLVKDRANWLVVAQFVLLAVLVVLPFVLVRRPASPAPS